MVGFTLVRGDEAALGSGLPEGMFVERRRANDRARVQTALRPLIGAFAGFAALAGATTVVVVAQATTRLVRRRPGDDDALEAVGCSRRQLVAADLACAATVAASGVAIAVVVAVTASPLFPVGPARRVRSVVGRVDVDVAALGFGAVSLAAAMLLLVGVGSWRRRSRSVPAKPGYAPAWLGSRPSSSVGLRLATGRQGILATTAGVSAGLVAIFATLTFAGSLDNLARDKSLAGMTWDVVARENFTEIDVEAVLAAAQGDPAVGRVTALGYVEGEIRGTHVPGAYVRALLGDPWPPVSAGRVPRTSREIMMGRATMEALDIHIGDEVELTLRQDRSLGPRPEPKPMGVTLVGASVAPAIGQAGINTPRLDQGFLLSAETADAIRGLGGNAPYVVLFDLAPGGDPRALIARFPAGLPDNYDLPTEWFTSAVPAEVRQAEDARPVTWLGVGALALAVVATIGHTLLGSVRQRRRDYAMLKALGFTPGQVRSTVLWQSGAVLGIALVAAVPVGIAGGRWLWIAFAEGLGVLVRPVVPPALLGAAVVVTVVVVQGAALIPAALARRTPPGQALRAE